MKIKEILIITFFVVAAKLSVAQQNEWLQWLGPNANGSTSETNWNPKAILKDNCILWKTNVGMGHSTVSVKGNRVYTMGNREIGEDLFNDEIVCLNSKTGSIIWKYKYTCIEDMDPGPYSTPVLNDGYLYSISKEGHFICLNAEKGTLVWLHNLEKEGLTKDSNMYAGSPLIYKDIVFLNVNKNGIAFNKKNGKLLWNSEISGNGISSPVAFNKNNNTLIEFHNQTDAFAVEPETGEVKWQVNSGGIQDPVFYNDIMFHISHKGFFKYNMKNKKPELLWSKNEKKTSFINYVRNDKFLYGFGQKTLHCISIETGEIKWEKDIKGGSLIISNEILIVVDKTGNLIFVKADPEKYEEISRKKVLDNPPKDTKGRKYRRVSACWTNPVLCNSKIYVRNTYGGLVCVDVSI